MRHPYRGPSEIEGYVLAARELASQPYPGDPEEPGAVKGSSPARLVDRYGNRFFEVGDLVTRDGTDVHRVVDHNGGNGYPPDGMTVVCVKAPSTPWTKVGEEEFNTCRRYEWVGETIDG